MGNIAYVLDDLDSGLFADDLLRVYRAKKIDSFRTKIDRAQKISFRFHSIAEGDVLLDDLFEQCAKSSGFGSPMYWHLGHSWWPLIKPFHCFENIKSSGVHLPNCRYLSVGSQILDHFVASFYRALNVDSRVGVDRLHPHDFWIVGDFLVEQVIDPVIVKKIDDYYHSLKSHAAFDRTFFTKEFLQAESMFSVEISKVDPEQISIERIADYFDER